MKPALLYLWNHLTTALAAVGFGGSGIGLIKLIRHWKPPVVGKSVQGIVFDWLNDMASNNDRIGLRTALDGSLVWMPLPPPKPAPELPEEHSPKA